MANLKTQTAANLGIVISIIFLGLGIFSNSPSKEIDFYNYGGNGYKEYVGGDAYNIQIEASLRGGIIAGKEAARAIYFSASGITFIISLLGLSKSDREVEQDTMHNNLDSKISGTDIPKKGKAEGEILEEKEPQEGVSREEQ